MKKGVIIFCLTLYLFASLFVLPAQRASANPLAAAAVPVGIEIGAGVYVTGAIALAALAGAFGYTQYAGDIREHARMVWDGASKEVKQIMYNAVQAAYVAGDKALTVPREVYDYIKSKLGALTNVARTKPQFTESDIATVGRDGDTWMYVKFKDPYAMLFFGDLIDQYEPFHISCSSSGCESNINGGYQTYRSVKTVPNTTSIYAVVAWINTYMSSGVKDFSIVYKGSVDNIGNVDEILNKEKGGIFEWSPSTDTPIVNLPDLANFPAVDVATGNPLTWNPDAKTWEAPGGVAVPLPNVKVGSPSLSLDVPVPGDVSITYDDVTTGTKTKVTDTTRTGEEVGAGEGVGTDAGVLENILTGVQTIADVLTSGIVGDVSKINWDKLKMVGSAFTTAFPFSIPWDVGRAFDAVFGSFDDLKDTPEWEWKINFLGQQYPIKFKIDDYFLDWFGIIRSVMLILFDVGLVYAVRKMLGGAS